MHTTHNFYKEMLAIAIPITIQNMIVSSLNTLDTVMIATLGSETIAGVGLANQVFFFFSMVCFGIATGSSVMISQFNGRRDLINVRRVNAISSLISIVVGLVLTVFAVIMPEKIIGLMIDDPAVIREGAKYLQWVAISYTITGFNFANGVAMRSTGNAKAPLVASLVSFVVNATMNYILIFGKLGLPAMGVVGAAIGTILARIAEMAVILYAETRIESPLRGKIKDMLTFPLAFRQSFFKITFPVIINESFWGLGQVLYNVAFAMVGTEATAAVQVVSAILNIAFVIVRGLSNACTIMLGNGIGRGEMDTIYPYAIRFLKLGAYFGLAFGALLALTPPITLGMFQNLSPDVYALAHRLLLFMAFFYVLKAINSIIIVGVLRGGSDTKYSMYLEMAAVWLVGVPLAFIGAGPLKLPIEWVVSLSSMDEVVKIIWGMRRIWSKKWIHVIDYHQEVA